MTNNPLSSRRSQPSEGGFTSTSDRIQSLNSSPMSRTYGWFWFEQDGKIERMELAQGTRSWLKENEKQAKNYLRTRLGNDPQLLSEAYAKSIECATSPKAWSNRR